MNGFAALEYFLGLRKESLLAWMRVSSTEDSETLLRLLDSCRLDDVLPSIEQAVKLVRPKPVMNFRSLVVPENDDKLLKNDFRNLAELREWVRRELQKLGDPKTAPERGQE